MIYAIAKHSGCQKKFQIGAKMLLDRIQSEVGEELTINDVLMMHDGETSHIGAPLVSGASVTLKVLAHTRGEKIRVRHFKRRKHHMKRQGHRQDLTQVEVLGISPLASKAKAQSKTSAEKSPAAKKAKTTPTSKSSESKDKATSSKKASTDKS